MGIEIEWQKSPSERACSYCNPEMEEIRYYFPRYHVSIYQVFHKIISDFPIT